MAQRRRTALRHAGLVPGLLAVWLALVAGVPLAHAGTAEDRIFREANEAYAAGRYPVARTRYEQLVATGARDERLYYNLGNTYFKLGALGRAIWAYEKALRIAPDLSPARYNLEIARDIVAKRVQDKVVGTQRPRFTDRVVGAFSVTAATVLFFAVYWLAFGLLIAVLLLRPGVLRATGVAVTVLAFVATGVLGWIYSERLDRETRVREAIALQDTVQVREGPRAIATPTFKIHAGLKVRLQAREDRWWKIRLSNGLEGWVRADQLGEL